MKFPSQNIISSQNALCHIYPNSAFFVGLLAASLGHQRGYTG